VHTEIESGNQSERGSLENLGVDGRMILKRIFKKWDGAWTGLMWLKIEKSGLLL
jgi:hypothetical protein